jgi:chromosome segregation ATPase
VGVEKVKEGDSEENAVTKAKEEVELARASSADSGCLDDDLGSRWHTLEANEVATEKAAEKERQVTELCAKLADREQDLTSLRSECKLIRMQLLQEERSRNEFKAQMAEKDSALEIANQRISNLEEEVLKTHARCAAYEEDYAALKESFATQKEATLKELGTTQECTKAQMEKIQTDYETKLTTLESRLSSEKSEKERLVRDLKAALTEIEAERDQLKEKIDTNTARSAACDGEEKKEPEVEDEVVADTEKMKKLEEELKQFERMKERLAEKACAQASTIATLTEANENKDAQLTSLQEMIEMLLSERDANDNTAANQMMQRISSLRDKMREGAGTAGGILNMSRHGN